MVANPQTWQNSILALFQPKKEPMIVVIDPDNLLLDETLLAEIQNSSYDILKLEDEVAFRNRFERNYRSQWDSGEPRHVVIVVHTTERERHIPHDLLEKGKRIEVGVSGLFPKLNALVIKELDPAYYQELYEGHQSLVSKNDMMRGERQTVEFILRVVFGIEPAGVLNSAKLVGLLVDKHYRGRSIPQAIEQYILENLSTKLSALEIGMTEFSDSDMFFDWLSKQWELFVKAKDEQKTVLNVLNFEESGIRSNLPNLFADGKIQRYEANENLAEINPWIAVGLTSPYSKGHKANEPSIEKDEFNLNVRINRFLSINEAEVPQGKTDIRDWLNIASDWSEIVFWANTLPQESYHRVQNDLFQARSSINKHFLKFVQSRFSAVDYYQDNKGPISLAAVNSWLFQNVNLDERLALICFDGLALDQWHILKAFLQQKISNLSFTEYRTFAQAPSITPISRQALFSGRRPDSFSDTWDKTTKDAERWQSYWIHREIPQRKVAFIPVKASDSDMSTIVEAVDSNNKRLGILINLFDDALHAIKGMPLEADKRVLYSTLSAYLSNSYLGQLINLLLNGGYRIFISSDHGNICGRGDGIVPPKAFIETYARRVAIFDQAALAQEFADNSHGIYFRTKSLPMNVHPVYTLGTDLYSSKDSVELSHGGLSIEELVVPFVEVKRA